MSENFKSKMHSSDSFERVGFTADSVQGLDNPFDAMSLLEECGIPCEDLECLDDWKERLMCHYNAESQGSPRKQIESSLFKGAKENKLKRRKLIELMMLAKSNLLDTCPEAGKRRSASSLVVENLLIKEGLVLNTEQEFTERIDLLTRGECQVLVSGETSAGKSTVINMILEEDILPTHVLPCTSVITKIGYAPKKMAEIILQDGEIIAFPELNESSIIEVWNVVYEKCYDSRSKVSAAREVKIYLPLDFLKTGLKIIDSPGIGENEAMNKVLEDFIEENVISGFMYILFSDNEGGVDEDRLLNLLRVVLEKQKKKCDNQIHNFDPKSAVFVFNRWDLVDDKTTVYERGVDRIKSCWPNLDESQVICLAAKTAIKHRVCDPRYICEPYRRCLESLKDIYISSHETRIGRFYKWVDKMVHRSVHHLKTLFRSLDTLDQKLQDNVSAITHKLQKLREKSDEVIEYLQQRINDTSREVTYSFREHLRSPAVRNQITMWLANELVPASEFNGWPAIKSYLDESIKSRVGKILNEWNQENKRLEILENDMTEETRTQLHLLENEIVQVENDLQDNVSVCSDDDVVGGSNLRRLTLTDLKIKMNTRTQRIPFENIPRLPVQLIARIMKPFKDVQQQSRLNEYSNDPVAVMKDRAERHWRNLIKNDNYELGEFIDGLMERPVGYLNLIRGSIPKIISVNEELIEQIMVDRQQKVESREAYEYMSTAIGYLRNDLIEFGNGYIFVNDFADVEIRLKEDLSNGNRASQLVRVSDILMNSGSFTEATKSKHPMGLWAIHQNGYSLKNNQEENITIRLYLKSPDCRNGFQEVAKLRCLKHPNVASFMGIFQSDAFVFSGHLKSLRIFITTTFRKLRDEIPRLLSQTAEALGYVHKKNLVHMELSPGTITVDDEGDVKLSGLCLPRNATLPMDKEAVQVGDFVYLAPEVLSGEIYDRKADVYSFAGLLLELLYGKRCFENERNWYLDIFIKELSAKKTNVISGYQEFDPLSESLSNLVSWCSCTEPTERPDMDLLIPAVANVKDEKILLNISTRKQKNVIRKAKNMR